MKNINRWWKEIDRTTLILSIVLVMVGIILSLTGTTETSLKKGLSSTHYIERHLIFSICSILLMIYFFFQNLKIIRRISVFGIILSTLLIAYIIFFGDKIHGAKRWVFLFGFSLQPSEFIKPFFVILSAWFITKGLEGKKFGFKIIFSLFFLISCLLINQPDFGMTVLFMLVFFSQLFIAGLSITLVLFSIILVVLVSIISYFSMSHVRIRVDNYFSYFFDPLSCVSCQIDQSIKAFKSGGIFGKGLGQGTFKDITPDNHTDFIFSIAGEELGFLFCAALIFIFLIIVIRGLLIILKKRDLCITITVTGLVTLFGLQALINIGSSLGAIPTKGMTLPLISYGGSSMLSSAMLIGFLLSYTRKNNTK